MGVKQSIGTRIRGLRIAKNLSQGDIQKSSGLLRNYISRLECGHITPSQRTLATLSIALGVPVPELLGGAHIPDNVSDDDLAFLAHMRKSARFLTAEDKRAILARARKMAKV